MLNERINARAHAIIITFKNRQNQFRITKAKINDISDETLKMLGDITDGAGLFRGVNIYKSVLKIVHGVVVSLIDNFTEFRITCELGL